MCWGDVWCAHGSVRAEYMATIVGWPQLRQVGALSSICTFDLFCQNENVSINFEFFFPPTAIRWRTATTTGASAHSNSKCGLGVELTYGFDTMSSLVYRLILIYSLIPYDPAHLNTSVVRNSFPAFAIDGRWMRCEPFVAFCSSQMIRIDCPNRF